MTDDDQYRQFARLFAEGRRREEPEEHPDSKKLSAYEASALPPEEADAVLEHLAHCRYCTGRLLDLKRLLEPEEEDRPRREEVADLRAETVWRKVRAEMGWGEEEEPREEAAAEVSRMRRRLQVFQALAAVLLVGVVGLSFYSWHITQERKARRFDPNPVRVSVLSNLGTRGGEEPAVAELPRDKETRVLLTLEGSEVEYPEFRADIRRRGGPSLPSVSGLELQEGVFRFAMDSEGLESGIYDIEVYGLGKGPPTRMGQYTLKIVRR